MAQTHKFITEFHNVKGNTVSERKEAFSRLLKRKDLFSNDEDLCSALKNIQPKTYLESLFYVDTLIYFKRTPELLEVFKQGNEVHISKIIKQYWFFKEVFHSTTVEKFVNEFLPCTSFTIRMKVLKKLSLILNEKQMDEVFDFVEKRYGSHIAVKFLHYCSLTKVIEILSNSEITLRPVQVKTLLDKDLPTFKYYLEYYNNHMHSSYNNSLVNEYLARKHPQEMLKLKKEGKISGIRVGRRLSKKLLDITKDDIIKDISYYTDFLNKSAIVRKLQGSFKSVYVDLFPTHLTQINDSYSVHRRLLQRYPKKHQWNLFLQTFSRVFNKDLLDNLILLDTSTILLCHEKQIVQKWAEIKYMARNQDDFLRYMDPTKALALLKEKINVTSTIYDRRDLLKLMVNVCNQNQDMASLEKVLEYFCFRHRNEETYVMNSFLTHIRLCCKLQNFTKKHWQYINEQINILRVKNDFSYRAHSIFLKRYLEYLFKNGESFKDDLVSYINDTITAKSPLTLGLKNPQVEKEIIMLMINLIPYNTEEGDSVFGSKFNINFYMTLIINYVIDFSLMYKDYYVDLLNFPTLMNYIISMFNKTELSKSEYDMAKIFLNYNIKFQSKIVIEKTKLFDFILHVPADKISMFMDLITTVVTKRNRSEFENDMLHLYFNNIFDISVSYEILRWFIKNEPQTILPYMDKIVKKDAKLTVDVKNMYYLKQIKLLSHFNYDVKYIEFYKSKVINPKYATRECIKLLSMLDSTVGFITIVEEVYLPKKNKLDLLDEKMKIIYPLQGEIVKTMKNVSEPCKMLPVVSKFCVGDYLQSALPSLYNLFYRSPETQLPFYIDILSKGAVSVRKHAVFLSCELLDGDFIMNILRTTNEQNISNQKHLFLAVFKYFLKRPTQVLFDIFMSKLHVIDTNDKETLERLAEVEMPNNFRIIYIEKCWQYFESLKEQINVCTYLDSLLEKTFKYKVVNLLSHEFCLNIINMYYKEEVLNLRNAENFVCQVLKYRQAERIKNFGIIFDIILTLKNDNKFNHIAKFFKKLYSVALNGEDEAFVNLCSEYWPKIFSPVERFEEFILLQLLVLKYKSPEPFVVNYGKNVVIFFEQLTREYGAYIHGKFRSALHEILRDLSINTYVFFYNILQFKTTPSICILVLESLPSHVPKLNEKDVDRILQIVKQLDEPSVKIYYNSYIKPYSLMLFKRSR